MLWWHLRFGTVLAEFDSLDPDKRAAMWKDKQKHRDDSKRRYREAIESLRELKKVPCLDCGVQYPHYIMEFDLGVLS